MFILYMGLNGHRQTVKTALMPTGIMRFALKGRTFTEISIYGHKMDADRQIQISPYMSINGHRQTDGQYGSYRYLHIWA